MMRPLVISGSAHPLLAQDVAGELGAEPAACSLRSFPDGELDVEIRAGVRGQPVFVIQALGRSVGEHLLELLLIADACRRAGAGSITAIVPYFGFARQDRVTREGRPLGARVVAEVVGSGRFSSVMAVDLHSPVIASCIEAPVAHLTAVPAMVEALGPHLTSDSVVVAPDLGAVKLAESYARLLGRPLAVVSKVRVSPDEVTVSSVVGDVRDKRPIIVDDIVSTGSTADAAMDALLAQRCKPHCVVAATHGLFVGNAADRLSRPEVTRVLVTDSLPPPAGAPARVEIVRLAPLLGEAIRRMAAFLPLDELLAAR